MIDEENDILREWDGDPQTLPTDAGRTSKKAARVIEAAQGALHIVRALRWTDGETEPDLDKPPYGATREIRGWGFNAYTQEVERMWSTVGLHGTGKGGSQGGRSLYSTKLRALRALRRAVEIDCARKLAAIDEQIREEGAMILSTGADSNGFA